MQKLKKALSISTIVGVCVCALMLILSIFGINFLEGVKGDILMALATLTVGCFFASSAVNLIRFNKKIAYTGLAVIALAVVMIIISAFADLGEIYNHITFTVAALSILFNVLIYGVLRLQKKYLGLQIPVYVIVGALCVFLILMVWGVFSLDTKGVFEAMLVLIILTVVGLIVIAVMSNKFGEQPGEKAENDYVKISKAEYEVLLEKAKQLDEMLAKKE